MASIQWDSELMTNYAEAVNVPAGKKLAACVDETNQQPAIFSLSDHQIPKLQLIRVDKDGRRVILDLAPLLNLPTGALIETFDVRQSDELTVYLAFSVRVDDRHSNVWVVKPFQLSADLVLAVLPVRSVGRVHDIQIGPPAVAVSYPAIYLLHQPLNRTAVNSDVAQIIVYLEKNDWEARKDLTLPTNVQKILDIAPIYGGFVGHGLVYLCEQNAKRSLYAVLVRPGEQKGDRGTATQYQFPCTEDALSIATFIDFTDNQNRSSLLVGCGDGVRYMAAKELTGTSGISSTLLANNECLLGARDLRVAQTGHSLSLFAINAQEELAFINTNLEDLHTARAAPILPAGTVTSFSAMITSSKSNLNHSVVCNDADGNLTFLQQALDTGIWRQEPFYVEASGEMIPYESYTVTITAHDDQRNPIINGKIQLSAPSTLPVVINGRRTFVSPKASWFALDFAGELGVIIPTKTITNQPLTVSGLRDSKGKTIDLPLTRVDPASKVLTRMASLNSENALLDARTPDGESIWENGNRPSSQDAKNAAKCFSAINDALQTLPKDGKAVIRAVADTVKHDMELNGSIFMDGFLWLKHQAVKVKEWIVRKAGEVWEFVCEIGGKVMNFVLDCYEKVTEAASWIWEKLKIGWDKLCKFVGFLFSWTDILETKDTILGFLNAGLDVAANRVEGFNTKIDSMFSNVQKIVTDATGATSKPAFQKKLDTTETKKDKKASDLQNSASGKWVGERMKNGNAKSTEQNHKSAKGKDGEGADVVNIWNDRVEPIIQDFNKLVDDLAKDIATLFSENKKMSQQQMLERLGGNLLVNILEIVKKLLQAVVSVVAKVILIVKSFGNFKLTHGFLPSFYRWISKGKDLSLFEAISLLIAIPSTFIIKLVTGAKPPTFKKLDAEFIESIIAAKREKSETEPDSVQPANESEVRDVATLLLGVGCGAALIKVSVNGIKIAWKTMTGGISIGVGAMSPSAIMELFGMAVDAFSLYQDLCVEPADADTPGKDLLDVAIAVKSFRLAVNALYMLATKLGMDNPLAEQVVLCIDLITALINYSLYAAVSAKQLEATTWKDRDEGTLVITSADNFLETLSTIGYFLAASFKDKEPMTALIGMGCFQVAALGGVAIKSVNFALEYEKS